MTLHASPRIMVVEDEAITATDLRFELLRMGYQVCGIADNTAGALSLAARGRPDLVLMDIRLADGDDGIRTAQQLRQLHDVAVVFLTAHSDDSTLSRALESGPLAYLVKPFQTRELRTTIEVALSRHAREKQLREIHAETEARERHLQAANEDLLILSFTDALTGLANRRALTHTLEIEWRRLAREQRPLSVVALDVDHFKAYNDRLGHPAGDACLVSVARLLRSVCNRPGDLACRIGGEEFVLVLPDTRLGDAERWAQQLLESLRQAALPHPASPTAPHITVSAGLASRVPGPNERPDSLLASADDALYAAKASGRDRLVVLH